MLVTEQVKPGGKRSHVETLRAGLEAIGWRVSLVDWGHLSWVERAWVAAPALALNRLEPALGHRWMLPKLERCLAAHLSAERRRSQDLRIIHVNEPVSFFAARRGAPGVPLAITIHGPWHREVASGHGLDVNHSTIRLLQGMQERAYREADAVISVDRAHAEYVRALGRHERLWVIPNFVDTRRFHPAVALEPFPDPVERWIARRPVVLCHRLLVPKNGVRVAIDAMHILRDRGAPGVLVIAGDGPERRELEAHTRTRSVEDRVWFLGMALPSRIPGWCRRASAVVVPSVPSKGVEEATSISALEGQACARPVVASALGGLKEIIRHGDTGLLVPPGDAGELASALERVVSDTELARRLGEAGALEVVTHHSHEVAARAYAAVYDQLAPPAGSA